MKKTVFVILSLCALVLGGALSASARSEGPVSVKIPFAFYAGDQFLPAGEYVFQMPRLSGFTGGSIVKITTADNHVCQHMLSTRVDGVTTDTDLHVTFSKYGDVYFLSGVRDSDFGAALHPSKKEKQAASAVAAGSGSLTTIEYRFTRSRAK